MNIKQNKQFKYEPNFSSKFSPLDGSYQYNISFLAVILTNGYSLDKGKNGEIDVINRLQHADEIGWNDDIIAIDQIHNLVYMGANIYYGTDDKSYDEAYQEKIGNKSYLQLYQENILDNLVITKENFIHILRTWDKLTQQQSPFALLYQDENDWFDALPFDSQESMEQFIIDHTQQTQP